MKDLVHEGIWAAAGWGNPYCKKCCSMMSRGNHNNCYCSNPECKPDRIFYPPDYVMSLEEMNNELY